MVSPTRFARSVGDSLLRYARSREPSHPTLRGYHLATVLRDLTDPINGSDVSGLARQLLATGDHSVALLLADALEEANHPLARAYRWRAVPRSLAIDLEVRRGLRRMAAHRNAHSGGGAYGIPAVTEHDIASRAHVGLDAEGLSDTWGAYLSELAGHVRRAHPDATDEEVHESVRRLYRSGGLRANYPGESGRDLRAGQRRIARAPAAALDQAHSRDFRAERFFDTAERFRRLRLARSLVTALRRVR